MATDLCTFDEFANIRNMETGLGTAAFRRLMVRRGFNVHARYALQDWHTYYDLAVEETILRQIEGNTMSEDETPLDQVQGKLYGPEEAPKETEPEDDAPEPEEDVPDPAPPVEPRLSFGGFAAVSALSGPAQSALRKWMSLHGGSPDRHYSLEEWQDYRARMLSHT